MEDQFLGRKMLDAAKSQMLYTGVESERCAEVSFQVGRALLLDGNSGAAKPSPFRLGNPHARYCCSEGIDKATLVLLIRLLTGRFR